MFDVDLCLFFFFKQKTAYDMRISDWSSDVCSSDLNDPRFRFLHGSSLRLAGGRTGFPHMIFKFHERWPCIGIQHLASKFHGQLRRIAVYAGQQSDCNAFQHLRGGDRSEEHTSELQSLMSTSYAVCYLKKNKS